MAIIGYSINRIFIDTRSRDRTFEMNEPHVHNHYELFYLNRVFDTPKPQEALHALFFCQISNICNA